MTTPLRPSLVWFGSDALADIELHNLPAPHMVDYYRQRLTFRDVHLRYWQIDADSSWHAYIDNQWTIYQRPSALEGYDPCLLPVAPIISPDSSEPWEQEPISADDLGPAAALAHAVELSRDAYFASRLAMWDAEATLHRCYAVTRSGQILAPGARSGHWFEFAAGCWHTIATPSDGDLLRTRDEPSTALRTNAEYLLEHGPLLPEPITAPWNPPTESANLLAPSARSGHAPA